MKSILYRMVCGVVMGVGGVLPGVSGGILAISLGVYEKMMLAIGNFFHDIKANFRFLFPLVIGGGIGILLTSNVLSIVIDRYEIQLLSLFAGLVLGSLPELYAEVKRSTQKISWKHIAATVLGLGFVLLFALGESSVSKNAEVTTLSIPGALAAGAVLSVGTVIPGISSSFILVYLGLYPAVIAAIAGVLDISSLVSGGVAAAMSRLASSIVPLLVMTAAFAVVSLIIIKGVNRALKRHHALAYAAVIGFVAGSVALVIPTIVAELTWVCPALFVAGVALSYLEYRHKKKLEIQTNVQAEALAEKPAQTEPEQP